LSQKIHKETIHDEIGCIIAENCQANLTSDEFQKIIYSGRHLAEMSLWENG
jgi:hypothetical protein